MTACQEVSSCVMETNRVLNRERKNPYSGRKMAGLLSPRNNETEVGFDN